MLLLILLFILGLVILSKSSDFLIDAALSLGKRLNLSPVFIGLTVIAFGTSLPEFFVSFIALSKGSNGISIGNIIGSNIANVALIIGLIGIFFPLQFKNLLEKKGLRKKEYFMIFIYIVFIVLAWDNLLSVIDGIILCCFFVLFLIISYKGGLIEEIDEDTKHYGLFMAIVITILSLVGLVIGADLMTNSAVQLAKILGIEDYIIGATIVAVGTSLPELAASFSAVKKGETAMSLANIVGSNIFNILMVLGFSSIIFTIPIQVNLIRVDFILLTITALILLVCVSGKYQVIPKKIIYLSLLTYLIYLARLLSVNFL
jgi:cation:H+ antiporter